jgi:hypothetical protein
MKKILKELKGVMDTGILPNGDHIDVTSKIYIEELYTKLSIQMDAEVIVKTADEELEHIAKRLSTLAGIPKSWEDVLDRLYHGYQLPFKFEDDSRFSE